MSINIYEFAKQFNKEYQFLYEHDNVAGYDEAVDAFDEMMENEDFRRFVSGFVSYRQDLISSDREAAAFMFALESFETDWDN